MRSAPVLSLRGRALRLLAAREHSRAELQRKLAPHADDAAAIDRLLDELAARGLLSEQRAAEALAHRRAPRLGTARVLHEMRQRGIDGQVAADVAATLRGTELARAREVWRKRFGAVAPDTVGRARQMRFLAARGFAAETIRRVISGDFEQESGL